MSFEQEKLKLPAFWIGGYAYDWGSCSKCDRLVRRYAESCDGCGENLLPSIEDAYHEAGIETKLTRSQSDEEKEKG